MLAMDFIILLIYFLFSIDGCLIGLSPYHCTACLENEMVNGCRNPGRRDDRPFQSDKDLLLLNNCSRCLGYGYGWSLDGRNVRLMLEREVSPVSVDGTV